MDASVKPLKVWGIIGLGWLGQALADQLQTLKCNVWGTRTDSFVFGHNKFPTQACDVLFLNTPPILDLTPDDFVHQIVLSSNSSGSANEPTDPSNIPKEKESLTVRSKTKLIFISSTSVYGPTQKFCTEDLKPIPWTANGKWLFEVENLLLEKYKDQVLILRPGGLIGDKRHPVFYFSKSQEISGGQDPINLIHRLDLINIIMQAEALNLSGVINAVAPYHPGKAEYYNSWAEKLKIKSIAFNNDVQSFKIVDSKILPTFYHSWAYPELDSL